MSITAENGNDQILSSIPEGLRFPLIECFNEIQSNFAEQRWDSSELNGGKLCEIVYSIIKGYIDGSFPVSPSKPSNMTDACRQLEQIPASSVVNSRSIRIQIPRMLNALYEIRNNRGVGHSGGDVNPNHMDAVAVLYMSKWLMAELIRIFHNTDINSATEMVESLVERKHQLIWVINGNKRVLNTELSLKNKTMVLLYQSQTHVHESGLINWLEISTPSNYRRDVLRPLHKIKYIEFDEQTKNIYISPKGIEYVEKSGLLN